MLNEFEHPLSQLYTDWLSRDTDEMDAFRDSIASCANDILRKRTEEKYRDPAQPVYPNTRSEAIICVCDPDPNRQGYRDALHIVNEIVRHYERDGIVANRYEAQHPIRWATQEEDTHPYYFAAVGLPFYAPAIFKEVPET